MIPGGDEFSAEPWHRGFEGFHVPVPRPAGAATSHLATIVHPCEATVAADPCHDGGMLANDLLLDAFGRVAELVPLVLNSLSEDDILWRPDDGANSIGWLIWHLARVEDDHLAGIVGSDQVWTTGGWAERFGLPYPPDAHGYGQTADEVAQFSVGDADLLAGYYAAVAARTREIVTALSEADYARVVDTRWDPPVTAAVRLVSVVNDITQHLGQAGYVRGLRERELGRASGWAGTA